MDEEPVPVPCVVICRNSECVNYDVEFTHDLYPNPDGVFRAWCGRCSTAAEVREVESE